MSTNSSLNAAGFSSSRDGTTAQRDNSLSHKPNTDWIGTSLLTAKALAAGAEYPDFPCLHGVLQAVKQLAKEPQGFREHFKEVMKVRSTTDETTRHQEKIKELRLNLILNATVDTNFKVEKVLNAMSTGKV
ncbi:hypothetical protein B0H19DRAFT_1272336 [Mycena capillaripes]|nr:hypothetical protein B0H19DRAFT_1272336 [Mycena capillaripes]